MSAGEKTYEAMRQGIIKALTKSWHLDWDEFARPAYEAFIEDVRDDASVRCSWRIYDAEGDERKDLEFEVEAYIQDADAETLGKPMLLSDILVDFARGLDVEETERLVASSLAAFRKKMSR